MNRRKQLYLLLVSSLICLLGCVIWTTQSEREYLLLIQGGQKDVIDLKSGFYNEDIEVKKIIPERFTDNICIHYTLNGDTPTVNSTELGEFIYINSTDKAQVIVLKALVCYKEEEVYQFSETYVIGDDIYNRYSTKIVTITVDDDALFNEKNGLWVRGEAYEDYVKNGGDPKSAEAISLHNYRQRGDNWTRNAQISIWNQTGECLVDDDVLFELDGNGSREAPVKSLQFNLEDGSKLQKFFGKKYDKVQLKAGGQEFNKTTIRWDVVQDLEEQMGIATAVPHELVVVYVNGEYYAVMSLTMEYSNRNIAVMCNLENEDYIEAIKLSNNTVFNNYINYEDFEKWNLEDRIKWIEDKVDVESLFKYYAVELLTNNLDWPDANYQIWRYNGKKMFNEFQDGKWRFIYYDTDLSYLYGQDARIEVFGTDTVSKVFKDETFDILNELLKDGLYREMFINYLCTLMNTIFSEQNVIASIDKYDKIMKKELPYYEEGKYNRGGYYDNLYVNWIDIYKEERAGWVEAMKNAVKERENQVLSLLQQEFSLNDTYKLKIKADGISYKIGNNIMMCDLFVDEYCANYFRGCALELVTEEDVLFTINGETVLKGKEFLIDCSYVQEGKIDIKIEKLKNNRENLD